MTDNPVQGTNGNVFISYSRKDKEFVRKLYEGLVAHDVKAWVDWEGIPLSADWMDEITRAVNGADAFLVVISPDWLASKVCADELELGLASKKKLVPILYRDPEKGTTMHEKLAATNWVYMRAQDDYDGTLPKLVDAIGTDLDWVRQHTRLLNRANEWNQKNRNASFLLQGADLDDGEKWMAEASQNTKREVLPLQAQYISASRKEAVRRQRMLLVGVSLALVVSVILAFVALFQSNVANTKEHARATQQVIAEENAKLANAKEQARATQQVIAEENEKLAKENEKLAKQNEVLALAQRNAAEAKLYQGKAGELDVSTLLAIDSYQRSPSFQAEEILRQNITYLPSPIAQMSQAGTISEIHLHPDGKIFVSASADGTACVWNVIDGRKLYCVHQEKSLNDAVFSPDGNWLATAGDDGKVFLWAAGDGSEKTRYDLGEPVSVVAFSPDSAWLVIGHKQGLRAINLVNAKQKDLNVKMPSAVTAMAFSPDGLWGAVGTVSGATFIWKPGSLYTSPGPLHTEQVLSLAFSPNSRTFVSSGADSTVRLANTVSGREVNVWRTGDWAEEVAFSPDGTSVASASDDNRLWIWDVKTGREKFRLRHDGFVQRVTYSPDGQWVASTGFDQTLRLWGAQSGSQMIQVSLPGIGSAVAFSADGGTVIVGDRDGNLSLWKISALLARIGYLEFPEYIREVKLSADGQTMFANSDDRKVRSLPTANLLTTHAVETADTLFTADGLTYNLALSLDENWLAAAESYNNGIVLYDRKNKVSRTLSQEDKIITGLAFTPDSRMLASSGIGNKVYLWDVQTAKKTAELPNASAVQGLAISPDGTRLVAGLDGRASTTVWDLGTRTKIAELSQVGDVVAVVFSPDGKWVATGDTLGVVNLWDGRDFANPKPLAMLQINGKVLNLLFSPDQHWLVMGSSDTYLHIFDTSTWKEVSRIPHASDVTGVTFSQDGKWLYTVSRKVIQIWDTSKLVLVPNEKLIETACAHLISNLSLTQWQTLFYAEPYRLICPGLPQGKH